MWKEHVRWFYFYCFLGEIVSWRNKAFVWRCQYVKERIISQVLCLISWEWTVQKLSISQQLAWFKKPTSQFSGLWKFQKLLFFFIDQWLSIAYHWSRSLVTIATIHRWSRRESNSLYRCKRTGIVGFTTMLFDQENTRMSSIIKKEKPPHWGKTWFDLTSPKRGSTNKTLSSYCRWAFRTSIVTFLVHPRMLKSTRHCF